jgi:hypothetical protein
MGTMSASDAAPLPRLGEVFFDVRGNSRSMRLSWYADTGVAVFSIWQGGMCTGTFRLAIADLPRMIETLQRGPSGQRAEWDDSMAAGEMDAAEMDAGDQGFGEPMDATAAVPMAPLLAEGRPDNGADQAEYRSRPSPEYPGDLTGEPRTGSRQYLAGSPEYPPVPADHRAGPPPDYHAGMADPLTGPPPSRPRPPDPLTGPPPSRPLPSGPRSGPRSGPPSRPMADPLSGPPPRPVAADPLTGPPPSRSGPPDPLTGPPPSRPRPADPRGGPAQQRPEPGHYLAGPDPLTGPDPRVGPPGYLPGPPDHRGPPADYPPREYPAAPSEPRPEYLADLPSGEPDPLDPAGYDNARYAGSHSGARNPGHSASRPYSHGTGGAARHAGEVPDGPYLAGAAPMDYQAEAPPPHYQAGTAPRHSDADEPSAADYQDHYGTAVTDDVDHGPPPDSFPYGRPPRGH